MDGVQKDIYELLRASRDELTINQISQAVEVERHTAAKFLDSLNALGLCEYHAKGKAKLWRAVDSPLFSLISKDNPVSFELKALLHKIDENVTLQDGNHSILWSNKPAQTGKKCYEVFAHQNSVCKDCEVTDEKNIHVNCQGLTLIGTNMSDSNGKILGRLNIRKS